MTDQTTTASEVIPRHGAKARARLDKLRGPRLAALHNWMQANDGRSPGLRTLAKLWGYSTKSTSAPLHYVEFLVDAGDLFIRDAGGPGRVAWYEITPQGLDLAKAAR
jgi:hypothetical protein